MPTRLVKTEAVRDRPGVFERLNDHSVRTSYTQVWLDRRGRQRKTSAKTLAALARKVEAERVDDRRGENRVRGNEPFAPYARRAIETYQGRTTRGFSEETRDEYRRDLERHLIPFLHRVPLYDIDSQLLRELTLHLEGKGLKNTTITRILAPLKVLLATAVEDGILRYNPTLGFRNTAGADKLVFTEDDEDEDTRALSAEQAARILAEATDGRLLLFRFLFETGVRISEAIALARRHVDLDAGVVRVRRRWRKARFGPPKSRYGKRDIPLSATMVHALREHLGRTPETRDSPAFPSETGTLLDPGNVFRSFRAAARRATRKAVADAEERGQEPGDDADVDWAGLHTCRHTAASLLFAQGWNAVQVQRLLGHHSPEYTLKTYVHLLPGDMPSTNGLAASLHATDDALLC